MLSRSEITNQGLSPRPGYIPNHGSVQLRINLITKVPGECRVNLFNVQKYNHFTYIMSLKSMMNLQSNC